MSLRWEIGMLNCLPSRIPVEEVQVLHLEEVVLEVEIGLLVAMAWEGLAVADEGTNQECKPWNYYSLAAELGSSATRKK